MEIINGIDNASLEFKIYDSEGFDYFFNDYVSLESINDTKLRNLVAAYRLSKSELEAHLISLLDGML